MNQIEAPKLQSDSKYPSVLRTSVCDRAGKGITFLYCYYTHYIDSPANKQDGKFVTPKSCGWIECDTICVETVYTCL